MCGFLGEFLFTNTSLTSEAQFKALLKLSKHRGPDATLTVTASTYQLGFNRLSILDLSTQGNQPKQSPSKRYHVVFNGEIYNYKALASAYTLSDLRSTSDTDVLVHLLDAIGIEATINALNGMFAIAVIDTKTQDLYLTLDFAGIKPLFYGVSKHGIVFASQFNQVLKHPFFESGLELRTDIMKEYFGLGYMQAPHTIYKDIYQVHPGELIKVSSTGHIVKQMMTSYSPFVHAFQTPFSENAVSAYDRLLNDVIKTQLVSDVPLASFLSGGIDSPLVSAIAKKQKPSIETFTLAVDHEIYDESQNAMAYAQHINAKHSIKKINTHNVLESIDAHFQYMTEPFGDYSSIPTYVIAQQAKQEHTVMLSGDGGDELFFGYPRMLDVIKKRHWFVIPHGIRKPLVRGLIALKLYHSWAPYNHKTLDAWVLAKHLHIPSHTLDQFLPDVPFSNALKELYQTPKKPTKKSLLHWLRYNEFYGHLQRVLIKVDRMSMAHSLEVRVPFLDKKSIAFAWKHHPNCIKGEFELKGLLKKLMALYYPESMIEKQKQGFAVPLEDWLRSDLKADIKKVVFETPIYGGKHMDCDAIKTYVSHYLEGKHNETWGVWHVYAWQKWALAEKLI